MAYFRLGGALGGVVDEDIHGTPADQGEEAIGRIVPHIVFSDLDGRVLIRT